MEQRIDLDLDSMRMRQYIAFGINGFISFVTFVFSVLVRVSGERTLASVLFFISMYIFLSLILGVIRYLRAVPLKSVEITEEYVKLNDIVYPNSTDRDIIYYLPNPHEEKMCILNLNGSRLRVVDKGDNSSRNFWLGPLRHKKSSLKRAEIREALSKISEIEQVKAVDKERQKAEDSDMVEVDIPRKDMIMNTLKVTVLFLGLTIILTSLMGNRYGNVIIDLIILPIVVLGYLGSLLLILSLINLRKVPNKIVIDGKGVSVDNSVYPFSEYNIFLWEGKNPRGKEIPKDHRMILVMEREGERKEYLIGSVGYPYSKQKSAVIDMALARFSPAVPDDSKNMGL